MSAVSKEGGPIPWYTYPSIDFLKYRTYEDKRVLEFGGGQSSLWWAERAKYVVTLEGNPQWYEKIRRKMPANVDLRYVSMKDGETNVAAVKEVLASLSNPHFDVIVIDGLYRAQMVDIACECLAEEGIIICDNSDAESYNMYNTFRDRGLERVDFYGNAPGVVLPHCTSIFYRGSSFVFNPRIPIHIPATEW